MHQQFNIQQLYVLHGVRAPLTPNFDNSFDKWKVGMMGRDSSVGIATRYGLDGPGIEYRWRGDISIIRPHRPYGPPSLLYNGYRCLSPGGKRPGLGFDHPPPSSAEINEIAQLYLYSPSGPWWLVLGWPLPLDKCIALCSSRFVSRQESLIPFEQQARWDTKCSLNIFYNRQIFCPCREF